MVHKSKWIVVLFAVAIMCVPALAQKAPAKRPAAPPATTNQKSVPITVAKPKECPIPRNELQQVYRMYMKDGSFQPVTQCELLDGGQRVHYRSAERNEWEDVPVALVD